MNEKTTLDYLYEIRENHRESLRALKVAQEKSVTKVFSSVAGYYIAPILDVMASDVDEILDIIPYVNNYPEPLKNLTEAHVRGLKSDIENSIARRIKEWEVQHTLENAAAQIQLKPIGYFRRLLMAIFNIKLKSA